MCPDLILITSLHFSNAELLAYLITYQLCICTLFHLPVASTWIFFFFLTYLRSFYLSCKAQLRRFWLSKAFFHSLATEMVSLSSALPPYFIYVLISTFFFLLSIIVFLHIFSPSLDWVSWNWYLVHLCISVTWYRPWNLIGSQVIIINSVLNQ